MKVRFSRRLSTSLSLVPLLATLVIFSVGGYALYYFNYTGFLEGYFHPFITGMSEDKRQDADGWFRGVKSDLWTIAGHASAREMLAVIVRPEEAPETAEGGKPKPLVTARLRRDIEAQRKARQAALDGLTSFLVERCRSGKYRELAVLSMQGKTLASNRPEGVGKAPVDLDFSGALIKGLKGPAVLRLRSEGKPGAYVDLLTPIAGPDNGTGAFLYAAYDTKGLEDLLKIMKGGFATVRAELIDGDGNLVLTRYGPPLKVLRYNLPVSLKENTIGRRDRFFFYVLPLGEAPFRLISIMESGEVMQPMLTMFGIYVSCAALILLIMVLQGLRFSKKVTRPLSRLCSSVKTVSMGNLELGGARDFSGELLELKTAFDTVISQMQEKDRLLKDGIKVEDRTGRSSTVMSGMSGERLNIELRAPLNDLVEDLRAAASGGDAKMGDVSKAAAALLGYVDDLAMLAGLEEGSVGMVHSEFPFCETMEEVGEEAKRLLVMKEIELIVDCSEDLKEKPVYTDRRIFTRLLSSLALSAVKGTDVGTITLAASLEDKAGVEYIVYSVADTGTGFSEEELRDLLEESSCPIGFLQYAVAKGLTHALGGEMEAESVEGKGSVFTVTIPLKPSAY